MMSKVVISATTLQNLINLAYLAKEWADNDEDGLIAETIAYGEAALSEASPYVFTKEEYEQLEKHFDLEAFFSE
ncbi:hypothetical protein GARY_133 [Vibrio phage Gary]|uniref:Uncharacterized protein n=1 Tax=Vibrio phage Gary TaxID=2801534 RepID=A0A7U0G882_9CAUD|nr:hypothetical protein KNV71_gp183 [Vibrio phage Gary]QQV88217.1 hypothetical protein GARY_133 [Vibrio phage Gary]